MATVYTPTAHRIGDRCSALMQPQNSTAHIYRLSHVEWHKAKGVPVPEPSELS